MFKIKILKSKNGHNPFPEQISVPEFLRNIKPNLVMTAYEADEVFYTPFGMDSLLYIGMISYPHRFILATPEWKVIINRGGMINQEEIDRLDPNGLMVIAIVD